MHALFVIISKYFSFFRNNFRHIINKKRPTHSMQGALQLIF